MLSLDIAVRISYIPALVGVVFGRRASLELKIRVGLAPQLRSVEKIEMKRCESLSYLMCARVFINYMAIIYAKKSVLKDVHDALRECQTANESRVGFVRASQNLFCQT